MNPKKERRRARARHQQTRAIPMQMSRPLKEYYKDNGKEIPTEYMFVDKEGNPLYYSQLSPVQKLVKLQCDIECNSKLKPYILTPENAPILPKDWNYGDEWVPCLKQLNRLHKQALAKIEAEPAKVKQKEPKQPVAEKTEQPLCANCHGKGTYYNKERGAKELCPILEEEPQLHPNHTLKLAKWHRRTPRRDNKA